MTSTDERFNILLVCTGNVCRSPLAAQLLALQLADEESIITRSAGTHALVDKEMPPPAIEAAHSLGVEAPEQHRGVQLTDDMLDDADLILVMERSQRREVVERSPRATRRLFTIREFARLADNTTDADIVAEWNHHPDTSRSRLQAAVRAVTLSRSSVQPLAETGVDDVIDPYGRGPAIYSRTTEELVPAVESTVSLLRRSLEVKP